MRTPKEDIKQLVEIPSFSGEEDQVATWMENRLKSEGFKVERLKNHVWSKSSDFDRNKPTILLNSHMDTVKPCSTWDVDPFSFIEKGDKWIALGINDAGASLIGLLHAFIADEKERLAGEQKNYNLLFLASAEEENSGMNGMEFIRDKIGNINAAIVGEPTNNEIAIAEKGLMVIDASAEGVAGHTASNTGVNAIYLAISDIEKIKNHKFVKESVLLGNTQANVTQIQAGILHNVIPDKCSFTMDVRINEMYTHIEVLAELQAICVSKLMPRSMRLCSSGLETNHFFERTAKALNITCFGSPTMSDQALMPWPSIKYGIGVSERSHTANEFIYDFELAEGIKNYSRFLKQLNYEIMG